MQLININKTRYRRHLNIVIVSCVAMLAAGSLAISQTLIAFFPDPSGRHFHWNLTGVIITCMAVVGLLHQFRHHNFMEEVFYVWKLKQALNKIHRKMTKLQAAAQEGNVDAMIAMQYSYAGSRLLWQLDDNTITMDQLSVEQAKLDSLAVQYNQSLDPADYDPNSLKQF